MDEIRIINQPDYQSSVAAAINRRTNFKIENGQLITQHRYTIGKKDYVVNSIFDLDNKQTIADSIKRLIDNDFD
ncbi:MAG: hypothetical protein IJH36_13240, partial [Clostridia bacterium]|nr:hypothetical protein [Clostridia bacterium]